MYLFFGKAQIAPTLVVSSGEIVSSPNADDVFPALLRANNRAQTRNIDRHLWHVVCVCVCLCACACVCVCVCARAHAY